MIPLLLTAASFLNFVFYIYAIGFVIALGLEQFLKVRPLSAETTMNERNMFIVQTNRKVFVETDMDNQYQLVLM